MAVETAIFESRRIESDWKGDSVDRGIGGAFMQDASRTEAFAKLSRYEALIERGLYKALHELQRLQAARAGVPVPPPEAADVDVNVTVQGSGEDLS